MTVSCRIEEAVRLLPKPHPIHVGGDAAIVRFGADRATTLAHDRGFRLVHLAHSRLEMASMTCFGAIWER